MKRLIKILKYILYSAGLLAIFVLLLFAYFNLPGPKPREDVEFGVTFSKRYAEDIQLDWKKTYIAILDDLNVKKIRIPVYWDLVEKEKGVYDFSDVDWQLEEAAKRGAEAILVVGQKVPRWPECAIPEWARDDKVRKSRLPVFIGKIVDRYQSNETVKYWQVENEPFLPFGICPELDVELLDSEIALVKKKDPTRKVIITDSGELSLWVRAAQRADIFGTTMYRTIWKQGLGEFTYPVGPRFFRFKYWLNKIFAGNGNAIVIELQAEPWISGWTTHAPAAEQLDSMNEKKFIENVEYARRVGFPEVYFWGAEWWFWMKENQNYPQIWDAAKQLFVD